MLVEDNSADIFLVEQAISKHRLDVDLYVMNDGEEAMNFFRCLDDEGVVCPNLLLLDLNIPKVDGFRVLSHLRASKQCAGMRMRVIVMTSSDASLDRETSASLGVSVYFTKPDGFDEFLKIGEIVKGLLP